MEINILWSCDESKEFKIDGQCKVHSWIATLESLSAEILAYPFHFNCPI